MEKFSLKISLLFCILSIFFLYPKTVFAAADPIAHFKFDDGSGTTPDDSSSNNVSASFTATNPTWSTDVSSTITFNDPYSLDFTGNGDAVDVTWPASLDFSATEPRSFSFWYRPTANGEGQYSRLISWSNDRLEIAGTNGTTNSHKIAYFDGNWNDTDITLTLGTWYHIIFTYDGTNAKFYINNELQDEHALAGRALSGTMRIGNRVQQLDEGINGKIDDVRIYDYALNESQIQNLAEGSNNPDGDPTPTPTPTRTPTPTPTTAASSTTTSTTNSSSSSTSTECTNPIPSSAPNLFQISTSLKTATVYFSPVSGLGSYVISYGTSDSADQHSVSFNHSDTSGAVSYTIGSLNENTQYFFKVRGMNGCAPGSWSQILKEKTTTAAIQVLAQPTPTVKPLLIKVSQTTDTPPNERVDQIITPSPSSLTETQNSEVHNLIIKVADNGKPIVGATVELHSTPRRTTTDKEGFARFSNVEKGEHTVKLAYQDYQGEQKVIVDGKEKDLSIHIAIEMKPNPTKQFFTGIAIGLSGVCLAILIYFIWKKQKPRKK